VWRRIYWLARKDLLESLRNQVALLILCSPFLLAWIFQSTGQSRDLKLLAIGVLAPADSGLVRVLEQHPGLQVRRYASLDTALAELGRRRLTLVAEAETGFDEALLAGQRPSLKLWSDTSRPTQVALAREYVRTALRQMAGQQAPARIEPQATPGRARSAGDLWFASTVLLAALSAMVVTASNLAEEKEAGTLQQMLLSPASLTEVWLGKLVVGSALGTIAAMSVVALRGSSGPALGSCLGLTVVASFVFAATGGIIGLLANGSAAASSWTGLCFIAFFVPASLSETSQSMSRWAQASPAYYLYDGIQRTVLAQEPMATLVVHFGILVSLGLSLTFVGRILLKGYR
jgi:ABC-2 type transport system permease protein